MTHFPVTNSILSPHHLAVFLQETYGLSKNTECHLIRAAINHTYVVTGPVKYVFRVYTLNWRTRTEILEEIWLLNKLVENNISVSYPIADGNQHYIQTLHAPEGDRYAVLFSYAKGEKVHTYPSETHFQIGKLMARLHQVTNELILKRVTYTADVLLVNSLKQLEKFLHADTEEMRFMRSTQKYLLQELSELNPKNFRYGVVHLDLWFDNINVTTDHQITIFDFDFCGNGWLSLDIAYYIMQLYNVEKYDAKGYQPKVDSFLKGYESIVEISYEERRLIPMLGLSLYYFYLGIQCQRYHNWSNAFLTEDYLKRFINGIVKRYFNLTIAGNSNR